MRRGSGRTIVSEDGGFRFELLSPSLDGAFEIAVKSDIPASDSQVAARRVARANSAEATAVSTPTAT